MDRPPHLRAYAPGLPLGHHPDVPHAIARDLAGEDGWTEVRHRFECTTVERGMEARQIFRFQQGVLVKLAVGPRRWIARLAVPAVAMLGLIEWLVRS